MCVNFLVSTPLSPPRGRSVFKISVRSEVSVHLDLKVFKLLAFLCFTRILTEIIQQRICYSFVFCDEALALKGKLYSFCSFQILETAKEFLNTTRFLTTVCVSLRGPNNIIFSVLSADVVWTKTDKSIEIYYTGLSQELYNYLITAAIFSGL